jgi:hypothetical protein
MDVRICEKKCPLKDECQEYIDYHKHTRQNEDLPLGPESQSPNLEAA